MQIVAINWHVYLLTHSPLALGFVGLTRVVPIVIFSLWGGVVADRYDRRRVMIATQSAMTLVALALGVVTLTGHETLWVIYLLNALGAAASAFDNPTRQALVPRLVPRAALPAALALNLTSFHASMICGPAIAGMIIAGGGAALGPAHDLLATAAQAGQGLAVPAGEMTGSGAASLGAIYALNALSFLGVLLTLVLMDSAIGRIGPHASADAHPIAALREGLKFVFTTPIMVWSMALDFWATFFAGAMSLLPIFADQVLGAGPLGYGFLVSAPAVGAILGSIYTSLIPLPRKQGRVLLGSVAAYGVATIVFGLSRSFALTFVALAATGLADLVSTVIRQTVRQLNTPDALRGRMTSISMIFFMGGPQLGELEAGLVASLFATAAIGATVSVVSGGLATLLVVALVGTATNVLRGYEAPDEVT